uniref:Ccp1 n=1 Tax=Arundo donax TaxID=35708 RepID=A0A0A9CMI2_ARUDO
MQSSCRHTLEVSHAHKFAEGTLTMVFSWLAMDQLVTRQSASRKSPTGS